MVSNTINTPNRLTVILPVVKPFNPYGDPEGIELVEKIHHRKAVSDGTKLLLNKEGTRWRPTVLLIMAKARERLKAGDNPVAIVHDLQAQLKLVI
jgi:hypothetical protein